MTLHIRQPVITAEFDRLIEDTLLKAPRAQFYRDFGKRSLDVAIVLLGAVPVVLVTLVLAALIALDGKSPFFLQKRVGRHGRIFYMWKLRSMVADAESRLEAHLASDPAARAEWDRNQKLRNDPRITVVGRIIRKTSLDELPQLFNVLRGDMSLVGPRPMLVSQQELYPGTAYYALRPGITGFWQISVRNESSFAERAGFDTDYLRQVSLGTDLSVIAKTFRVVLHGTGC
ncbi:sugar transferase [Citreicella sp. C3M06]|uniref:sugar transferase n=1 Tax=Roseobacteraceae TaxID=2854170 RepID=UPI001C094304|nr:MULTISPECIES: sugar transferase [Roseobacteraceae]MBU2959680.1 sugar transferase [Citreicella sp. C3M06]MDO6584266.1 sugar transferase [Salipiger sp. 1_MG-2023]